MPPLLDDDVLLTMLGASPYVVRAYRITVQAPAPGQALRLPSGRVALYAREIVFAPGAVIDVSGENGITGAEARPAVGVAQNGGAGSVGGDGGNGGRVTLHCQTLKGNVAIWANGAQGGRGGLGGDGTQGAPGADGEVVVNVQRWSLRAPPVRKGGKGGPGGAAGLGGTGGKGGGGGSIRIEAVDASGAQYDLQVNAGKAGAGGYSGAMGYGGKPGVDGYLCRYQADAIHRDPPFCIDFGNDGVGDWGTDIADGSQGTDGSPGVVINKALTLPDLASIIGDLAGVGYPAFLLATAEELYYNGSYEDASERLAWVYQISDNGGSST